jgi:glyoxylase-like metal-dependent hydrolase (beta-lactamase superfamily II)
MSDETVSQPTGHVTIRRLPGATLHVFTSPEEGELVNSIIVETDNALVLLDAPLVRPAAQAYRSYADGLGKPIDRIIVTHSHPDHWFGLESFRDRPIYALPEVTAEIEAMGDGYIAFKKQQQGDLIPDAKTVPTHAVEEGEVPIDGLRWDFTKVTQAESSVMLLTALPDLRTLLAQDLVYNHVHLYVGETSPDGIRCFDGWTSALSQIDRGAFDVVVPGHGEIGGSELIEPVLDYLVKARGIVATATSAEDYVAQAQATFPDWRVNEMTEISGYFLFSQPA